MSLIWTVGLLMLPGYANGFSMPKTVAWIAGGLALIGCQWINPPVKPALRNPWLGGLFLWVSFLFVWMTLWPRLWIPDTLQPTITYSWVTSTLIPTMTCWISFLVIDVLVRHSESPGRWAVVGQHLCALAGVLALYGLAQHFRIDPFQIGPRSGTHNMSQTEMVTVFGNPMITANCLAILAPLCLIFKPKWCRIAYGLVLLDLSIIQSATSFVACAVGSSLVWIFRKQWVWLGSFWGFCLVSFMWLFTHHTLASFLSLSHRQEIFAHAIAFWKTYPLQSWVGYGLGSVGVLTTNQVWHYGTLHCEPLQILFETGIVGFLLCLGWLGHLGKNILRMSKDTLRVGWIASAVSFGLVACASFPLRIGSLLMIGVLIVAALETFGEESRHATNYPA